MPSSGDGELIGAFVLGVAGVAAHPLPGHVMPSDGLVERLDEARAGLVVARGQRAQGLAREPLFEQLLGLLDVLPNVFDFATQLQANEVLCPVCKVVIRSTRELRPGI